MLANTLEPAKAEARVRPYTHAARKHAAHATPLHKGGRHHL